MASDDVAYNNLPDELKSRREYQFLKSALTRGNQSIHQGVYAITPSGKFLGKIDTGWPSYDPVKSLENLKAAKAKYESMEKEERMGRPVFTEKDRSLVLSATHKLESGTKLLTYARHYPFAEMELFDSRNPEYSKRDALWFSAEETKGLLPSKLEKGVREGVAKADVERLLLHGHLMFGCPAWWTEHIKKADMEVEVAKVEGDRVHLRYKGEFLMDANSQWNKSRYQGNLLGYAVWNTKDQAFEKLEWISVGEHTLQELKSNLHRGSTKSTKLAAYIRLAGKSDFEQQMLPHKWDEYPREMRAAR